MVRLERLELHALASRRGLEPAERLAVHRHRARGQAPLHHEVLQEGLELGRQHKRGGRLQCRLPGETDMRPPQSLRSRDSAALATSPMRTRNSVPISAL